MLLPGEHLFLFSKRALERLLTEIGLEYYAFEKPFFSQYDMFVIASRKSLKINQEEENRSFFALLTRTAFSTGFIRQRQSIQEIGKPVN